ncbi:TraR/DksA C4-type zinc finger protein [Shewanella sp. C32]|uniref:TraR/DksA C4-type zinc finger protein n=1 Tax=Shewanella electrica TaxID=515560 RepID=A0ABT2FKF1_9GAMM|nr:TraR/DksA C4-type zinc finger protein [Shewanella electrica]MCH1924743.1 TraR/DksA C4-type zinc finger protein [Shewanella electrica]MCS4556810.1 TraR/DksA C4-type zinc finger protein [Shewanella electrica]
MNTQPLRQKLSAIETELRQELTAIAPKLTDLSLSDVVEQLAASPLCQQSIYQRIVRLDAAICQLELGLYGLCADCEANIEPERLRADPTEQRCRVCDEHFRHQHRQELRLSH